MGTGLEKHPENETSWFYLLVNNPLALYLPYPRPKQT